MSYGKITTKQKEILEYIKSEILNKGYPPAVREICEAVKLKSTSSVHAHLETLEKNGYIRREMVNIPIIGTVTAGIPILAVENIEGYFPLLAEDTPKGESFMLHVKGESMINRGIYNGDMILIHKQETANNGDMIVALLDDSVTVKTFYREDDHIRLQPENDTMEPIIVDDVAILGKVVGLFRRYH